MLDFFMSIFKNGGQEMRKLEEWIDFLEGEVDLATLDKLGLFFYLR